MRKRQIESPQGSCLTSNPSCSKTSNMSFFSGFARLDDNTVFLTRHGLQFKLFPKLEHLQGPPYANQVMQKGTQAHTAGLYISTSHSGSVFTSSSILPSPREYQRIRTSFYSTFSLVIFKTGTDHASKSLQ